MTLTPEEALREAVSDACWRVHDMDIPEAVRCLAARGFRQCNARQALFL